MRAWFTGLLRNGREADMANGNVNADYEVALKLPIMDGAESLRAWQAHAALCELLALSFRYPDDVLVEAVASGEWVGAAIELASTLGLLLPDDFELVDAASHADGAKEAFSAEPLSNTALLHALRAEWTRLFVGSPDPVSPPYEGVWRASDDGVASLLFVNPHTRDVQRFCTACGVSRPAGLNEPLDHIVAELELLQYLASASADMVVFEGVMREHVPGGSPASAFRLFMSDHLSTWVPRFAARIMQSSRWSIYAMAACLLDAYVKDLA